jgi:YidC/Oxa1 family membrane protein insertase
MKWDGKALLAIVLCVIFYIGYTKYLSNKYPDYGQKQSTEQTALPPGEDVQSAPETQTQVPTMSDDVPVEDLQILGDSQLVFENSKVSYRFDQQTSSIASILLKDYPKNEKEREQPVELINNPLTIQATTQITRKAALSQFNGERNGNTITFTKREGDWLIGQSFSLGPNEYNLKTEVFFQNLSQQKLELTGGLWQGQTVPVPQESGGFFSPGMPREAFVMSVGGDHTSTLVKDYCEDAEDPLFIEKNETIDFIGYDDHYFLSVFTPEEKVSILAKKETGPGCFIVLNAYQEFGMVDPGQKVSLKFTGYFGPKDLNILTKHSEDLRPAVDFGIFSIIAYPLLVAIKFLFELTKNYGIAIILLTIALKVIFYPLTKAAAVSMKRMQKLQPEMTKLRERYKDDPPRQQQELMKFMATHKVNPAKGCLPILPQIPVFIAFYNVLSQAIELRHAEFFGWISDLSVKDPYYVTPLLLGGLMFLQQRMTPNPGMDKNQQRIMMLMPVIFTVMMLSLPAGMVLYMITNTIVSIGQQQWLNKKLDGRI